MEKLNKLFSLKKVLSDKKEETQNIDQPDEVQVRITYYQTGFGASKQAEGKPSIFRACLDTVYHTYEDQCRKQKEEQQKIKQPYIEDKQRQESELNNARTALSINEDKLIDINEKVNEIKHDIENVKNNPQQYGITQTKQPHALFYIGLILLIPITIYLFVFYISATYSAFFKEFSNDKLSAAIFDAQAFSNAMQDGLLEGILVVTIPSVFLGLGYIIHMIQKGKGFTNLFRIAGLYILTFLFDGLLAFQIEKKIYDFNKTLESQPYNLKIALGEAEFWMIIFAGFVVYIIWGLVFDLVMKEFENIDKIKGFIRGKQQELIRVEEQKSKILVETESIKTRISAIKGTIEELQNKIDGFILNIKQYLLYYSQYKEGWFQAIARELNYNPEKRSEIIQECENISIEHLTKLNLISPNHQHVIYSRIS
jgi:hypothetical protein